ncbi:uncharacterized protein LOC133030592 [Cannabis sativa]|uniref:uncharacterized protein LOC133030592 n=1 Tax=Cannabis sativa TaxID=3483 RepID=UPI0029CA5DF3|nr:uncharacterized protein LOC133030592 [Cannabis sativa]
MEEDESVSEFNAKLCDISNESYALGKIYSNKKLVRKLLGVLPKRFMSKVTSIEESRDIEALDLDELIGSLQNYELTLERWEKWKKTKIYEKEKTEMGVAFIHKEENSKEVDLSESFTDANLALLAKNYARFLKKNFKKTNPGNKENTSRRNFPGPNRQSQQSEKKGKGIQCHECSGFGHIQAECANTLKKKKALAVTWSDSEEEESSDESKDDKSVMAFMVRESVPEEVEGDDTLSDSESTVDEKNKAYEEMFTQWSYMAKRVKELQDLNKALDDSKCELEDKLKKMTLELCSKDSGIYKLTSELVRAKQSLSHVLSGTAALNQALQNQKPYGDRISIGYKLLYNQGHDLTIEDNSASSSGDKIKFVSASPTIKDDQPEIIPDESKPNSVKRGPVSEKSRVKQADRFVPTCHFCNKRGHIRPRCYKLRTYLTNIINRKSGQGSCNDLHNFHSSKEGFVTFGDGNKGEIMGQGDLDLSDVFPLTGPTSDVNYDVNFTKTQCLVSSGGKTVLTENRTTDHCYVLSNQVKCHRVFLDKPDLWHYRLGHLNYRDLKKIVSIKAVQGIPEFRLGRDRTWASKLQRPEENCLHIAVQGIPEFRLGRDRVCGPCQQGKQIKSSHPPINALLTSKVLELVHVDLMGPMQTASIAGKRYVMVCVDDFSRYTWVNFLTEKSDTFGAFSSLCLQLQNEKGVTIGKVYRVRSDHGKEFENDIFAQFCNKVGISHEFSAPKTPQQNGIVERKNRTLQEMARVMLYAKGVAIRFLAEAVNTACYICNRVHLRTGASQTPYELWKGKTPNLSHVHIFGCTCYILNDRDHLGKFDARNDEGIFLGYSTNNRAYRVYNKRTFTVMESMNVKFDDLEVSDNGSGSGEEDSHDPCIPSLPLAPLNQETPEITPSESQPVSSENGGTSSVDSMGDEAISAP